MYATTLTAVASVLADLGSASPTSDTKTCTGTREIINDDITPGVIPVSTFTNTTTGGLFHQAFNVISTQKSITGVKAHSPNNVAEAGSIQQMLNGNTMITTNFPDSKTNSFDANSIYFGCQLTANAGSNVAAVPQACSVSMTGYQGSDNSVANAKEVCSYTVNYNPSTNLGLQQLSFSQQFPSTCKGLNFLVFIFQIQPQTVNPAQERLVLAIDDFNTTTYKCWTTMLVNWSWGD